MCKRKILLNIVIMATIIRLHSRMQEEDILEHTIASYVHCIQLIDYCVT